MSKSIDFYKRIFFDIVPVCVIVSIIQFDNYIDIGDFNLEPSDATLKHFLDSNGLHNLIKGHTCFKGKGSLIDLILVNRKFSFKNTQSCETGLSDHHHMVYTMLKTTFQKSEPKQLIYRDFKYSILKVSKLIYWKIWLPVTDHMLNLIENLLWY